MGQSDNVTYCTWIEMHARLLINYADEMAELFRERNSPRGEKGMYKHGPAGSQGS